MFAETRPSRLYTQTTWSLSLLPFKKSNKGPFSLFKAIRPTAMAETMGDGDEEWMGMNDTSWCGLGLTDPIKNIEVSTDIYLVFIS